MNTPLSHEFVYTFVTTFCRDAKAELDDRWAQWKIDHKQVEVHEVVGALLARQVTLVTQFAQAFPMWNWSMAPLVLRPITEVYLNLKWILADPVPRSQAFIDYGLGQMKLQIEHMKAQQATAQPDEAADLDMRIKAAQAWIDSQLYGFLVNVNLAKWADNQREMAKEINELAFYNYAHAPHHASVHSMWQHVGVYNLKECTNPLHCLHKVPDVPEDHPDISLLLGAAHYLQMTFDAFDEAIGIRARVPSACLNLVNTLNPPPQGT